MNDLAGISAAMPTALFEVMRQEWYFKMRRAELGRLTFGRGKEYDVDHMVATSDVLEIKLADREGEDTDQLHVRFFYSEPLALPGRLVGLGLLWKRPGPVGVDEQTEFAGRMSLRLDEYSRREDYGL